MDKEAIYKLIQKYLENVPLILIGTGGTIPYGIPGMKELADRLINDLDGKYKGVSQWDKFVNNLNSGIDLENALVDVTLADYVVNDIIKVTWELINDKDIQLMKQWLINDSKSDLGRLIKRFYQANPQCVNIITTNYDRVIEYACDQMRIPVNSLFEGEFCKRFIDSNFIRTKQCVNLLKVHGSLDWFMKQDKQVVSIPLQEKIISNYVPSIITPGYSKYQKVLESPFRDILHTVDTLINKTQNYLCIGYGFNDSQIQNNIISGIQMGKEIVILTKELSNKAIELIRNKSEKYIIIQAYKGDESKTEIIIPSGIEILSGQIWTQKGLLDVLGG